MSFTDTRKDTQVHLKDVHFRAMCRANLRPLIENYPFFGGFAFQLLDIPMIDSSVELKRNFDPNISPDDIEHLYDFIFKKCFTPIVTPNQICIQLVNEISISRRIRFSDPLILCGLQIIAFENLKPDEENGVCNPFCLIKIGKNSFTTEVKQRDAFPTFDDLRFATIDDIYETCTIQVFNRIATSEKAESKDIFIGQIKFTFNETTFALKASRQLSMNGIDVWVPLEKAKQGKACFRCAAFMLSDDYKDIYNTVNSIQSLDEKWKKMPISVYSLFIEHFEINSSSREQTLKSTSKNSLKLEFKFGGKKFHTKETLATGNRYIFNEGFRLLNNELNGDVSITFEAIEVREGHGNRKIGKSFLRLKDVIGDELNLKYESEITFKRISNRKTHGKVFEFGDFAKAAIYISLKVVKTDSTTLTNISESFSKGELEAYKFERSTVIPDLIKPSVKEKEAPAIKPESVPKEMEKVEKVELKTELKAEECAVKMQISFISKQILSVYVICARNIPVFDISENPNPAVIVELWKNNVKIAQKATKFCKGTRDPYYGKKLLFRIQENGTAKYILRILIASKVGFLRTRVVLLAELFKQLTTVDVGAVEKDWFKMNVIGPVSM
ncbi:extended synaptotagmin-1-like isoform X1 [Dinothrombium tinctorium]|uniref:Extended synaptotagmin-1-like isoform X1 n=1 Tax=Dinothrombium tinctorium TaxID=1965070 RepID=A0A3S3SA05_9ACAR|nr:extended synaptotagmin-1-like isoform X1 [Dinothrombium tinctorium]